MITRHFAIFAIISALSLLKSDETSVFAASPNKNYPHIQVRLERGLLTLAADEIPLSQVLESIGEVSGLVIKIRGDLNTTVTESFTDVPIDQAIRQILRGYSFALAYPTSAVVTDERQPSRNVTAPAEDNSIKPPTQAQHRRWSIQVRSSPKQSEALRIVDALTTKGYQAHFFPSIVHGTTWYRVRVGPLSSETEAQALKHRIVSTDNFIDAFIVLDAPTETKSKNDSIAILQAMPASTNPADAIRINPSELTVIAIPEIRKFPTHNNLSDNHDPVETLRTIHELAGRTDEIATDELRRIASTYPDYVVRAAAIEALRIVGLEVQVAR